MKHSFLSIPILLLLATSVTSLDAKVVMLIVNKNKPEDQITIGTNEVAEVIRGLGNGVTITKGSFSATYGDSNVYGIPTFAGPATIKLHGNPGEYCIIRITPQNFPPEKSVIIPKNSKGAKIVMESSTDLVNWSAAMPGAYTNKTNNLFFRVRAERLP
ncbi:MAG: hypothetical protein HY674_04145 [Chloroflexi bacterium]|nr:hypothetical protein [Chloroflexota bacterium]